MVAELVNALYSLAFYPYSKVEGSNPGVAEIFSGTVEQERACAVVLSIAHAHKPRFSE